MCKLHGNYTMKWVNVIEHKDFLIRPDGFDIPYEVEKIHGISTELSHSNEGHELSDVLDSFSEAVSQRLNLLLVKTSDLMLMFGVLNFIVCKKI